MRKLSDVGEKTMRLPEVEVRDNAGLGCGGERRYGSQMWKRESVRDVGSRLDGDVINEPTK